MKALTTLSLMLALSIPTFASAQDASDGGVDIAPPCACDGQGPRGRRRGPPDPAHMQAFFQQRLETMTRELSLRPAQVQQVQAIFDAARGQAQAMRARRASAGRAGRPGPEMRRRHMRARFEVEERVAAVLDREQLLRWLTIRHQRMLDGRGRRPGRGRGMGHGPGMGHGRGMGRGRGMAR